MWLFHDGVLLFLTGREGSNNMKHVGHELLQWLPSDEYDMVCLNGHPNESITLWVEEILELNWIF